MNCSANRACAALAPIDGCSQQMPDWLKVSKTASLSLATSLVLHGRRTSQTVQLMRPWTAAAPLEASDGARHAFRGFQHPLQLLYPEGLAHEVRDACLPPLFMNSLRARQSVSAWLQTHLLPAWRLRDTRAHGKPVHAGEDFIQGQC